MAKGSTEKKAAVMGLSKRRKRWVIGAILVCAIAGPGAGGAAWWFHAPRTESLARLWMFNWATRGDASFVIHEGLPHHVWEGNLLAVEVANKPCEKIDGFWFYKETLAPSPQDANIILQCLADPSNFVPWSPATCGGYHPDWLLEWRGWFGARHRFGLCLGCDEAMLIGPSYNILCRPGATIGVEGILNRYRKNRPPKALAQKMGLEESRKKSRQRLDEATDEVSRQIWSESVRRLDAQIARIDEELKKLDMNRPPGHP